MVIHFRFLPTASNPFPEDSEREKIAQKIQKNSENSEFYVSDEEECTVHR